ncbi:hypothetical protein Tco_1463724, partial [Tanacetum coccineum]
MGKLFFVQVRELATWSVKIEDEIDEDDSVGNNDDLNNMSYCGEANSEAKDNVFASDKVSGEFNEVIEVGRAIDYDIR